MTLFGNSLRNLTRSPRRTILTTVSIAASLFVFSVLMSVPSVFDRILADRAGTLRIITHSTSGIAYTLPEAYRTRIARLPYVEQVSAFTLFAGIYHLPSDQFPNSAIDPAGIDRMWSDWGISPPAAKAFQSERIACLVGEGLMARFGWHVGQHIALRGTIYPIRVELQIVGVLGDKAPPVVLVFRRDYLEELLGRPGRATTFWVRVGSSAVIPTVIEEIDREFANSSAETQSESEAAYFAGTVQGYFGVIIRMAEILALLTAVAIMLVATNTASMSIRERRSEIAVMRAIGFTSGAILGSLLVEGLMIGALGAAIGCALGWLALRLAGLSSAALGPIAFALQLPPTVIIETVISGTAMGIGAAFFPGLNASRANIVDALRHVA